MFKHKLKRLLVGLLLAGVVVTSFPANVFAEETDNTPDRREYDKIPWVDQVVAATDFAKEYSDSPIVIMTDQGPAIAITHLDKAKAPGTVGYTTMYYEMEYGGQTGGAATFSEIYTQHSVVDGVNMIYTRKFISPEDVKAMCIATGGQECYDALCRGDYSKGFLLHGAMTTVDANGNPLAKAVNDGTGHVSIALNSDNYDSAMLSRLLAASGGDGVFTKDEFYALAHNTYGWSDRAIAAILRNHNHYNKPLMSGSLTLEDLLMLLGEIDPSLLSDEVHDDPAAKDPNADKWDKYANNSRITEVHHTWHEADTLAGENGENYALGDAIPSGKSLTNHVDANQYNGTYSWCYSSDTAYAKVDIYINGYVVMHSRQFTGTDPGNPESWEDVSWEEPWHISYHYEFPRPWAYYFVSQAYVQELDGYEVWNGSYKNPDSYNHGSGHLNYEYTADFKTNKIKATCVVLEESQNSYSDDHITAIMKTTASPYDGMGQEDIDRMHVRFPEPQDTEVNVGESSPSEHPKSRYEGMAMSIADKVASWSDKFQVIDGNGSKHTYVDGYNTGPVDDAASPMADHKPIAMRQSDSPMLEPDGKHRTIPKNMPNGEYYTKNTVAHQEVIGGSARKEVTNVVIKSGYEKNEPINVHTPIITPVSILNADTNGTKTQLTRVDEASLGHDWMLYQTSPENNTNFLILDHTYLFHFDPTTWYQDLWDQGVHMSADPPGYNYSGDPSKYNQFINLKQIRFPFSVMLRSVDPFSKNITRRDRYPCSTVYLSLSASLPHAQEHRIKMDVEQNHHPLSSSSSSSHHRPLLRSSSSQFCHESSSSSFDESVSPAVPKTAASSNHSNIYTLLSFCSWQESVLPTYSAGY